MTNICAYCNSSFSFEIADGRGVWTNRDGIMMATILWECPVCRQTNELKMWLPYTPIETYPLWKGDGNEHQ
jgi:hypothetical protein